MLRITKLREAHDALNAAHDTCKAHETNLLRQTEKFRKQQGEIDRRLRVITQSETSDEAVKKFDASMEKLQRFDIAKGYVDLLQVVERLR